MFSLQWIFLQKLESNILFSLDTYFKLIFGTFKTHYFQDPLSFEDILSRKTLIFYKKGFPDFYGGRFIWYSLKNIVSFWSAALTTTRNNGAKTHYESIPRNTFKNGEREVMEELYVLRKRNVHIHHSHETLWISAEHTSGMTHYFSSISSSAKI